jgi:DNA-binding XRE family transcriptional regulator
MPVSFKKPLIMSKIGKDSPIGLQIKKRRIELKLLQKDVAKILKVSTDCITYWENRRSIPQIQYAPRIIQFLGYNPYPFEIETLGGRIKYYRLLHGLSHKKLGEILYVDASTIGAWETNNFTPSSLSLLRLSTLLKKTE